MARTATGKRRAEERRRAYEDGTLVPQEDKWCRMCDEVKRAEHFYIRFDYDGLLSQYCRECHKKDCKVRKKIKRLYAQDT